MTKYKWQVKDEKDRMIIAMTNNNKLVFERYEDMSKKSRDLIMEIYAFNFGIDTKDKNNKKIKEMNNFLDFKDDEDEEFCG